MPICGLVRNTPSASKSPAIALGFFVLIPSCLPTALPAITRGLFYNPNEIEPMPEKDPTLWAALWVGLTTSPTWQGAIMASIIATLRILYDGKETRWTRILLESLICGCLSLAASSGIEWLGWPSSMAVALGGAIGFLGVTAIRDWLVKWAGKKADQ